MPDIILPPEITHAERRTTERTVHTLSESGLDDFIQYLRSPFRIIWSNLLAGIFRGLGLAIGATVVLALLTMLMVNYLSHLPFIGDFFAQAGHIIQNINQASQVVQKLGQ